MIYRCEIEYPDDCGPDWMNKDNLMLCLTTDTHCAEGLVKVRDENTRLWSDTISDLESRLAAAEAENKRLRGGS